MIGENINVMRDAWQKSKSEGKIWQVWAGQTVLAGQVPPSLLFCGQAAPAAIAGPVQQYCDAVLGSDAGGLFRAAAAMEIYKFPWNSDDFGGFAVERAAILEVAKNYANNPVVLAGDVHDSWAYTLYEVSEHVL
jgi:alkaline phosphatase D